MTEADSLLLPDPCLDLRPVWRSGLRAALSAGESPQADALSPRVPVLVRIPDALPAVLPPFRGHSGTLRLAVRHSVLTVPRPLKTCALGSSSSSYSPPDVRGIRRTILRAIAGTVTWSPGLGLPFPAGGTTPPVRTARRPCPSSWNGSATTGPPGDPTLAMGRWRPGPIRSRPRGRPACHVRA